MELWQTMRANSTKTERKSTMVMCETHDVTCRLLVATALEDVLLLISFQLRLTRWRHLPGCWCICSIYWAMLIEYGANIGSAYIVRRTSVAGECCYWAEWHKLNSDDRLSRRVFRHWQFWEWVHKMRRIAEVWSVIAYGFVYSKPKVCRSAPKSKRSVLVRGCSECPHCDRSCLRSVKGAKGRKRSCRERPRRDAD